MSIKSVNTKKQLFLLAELDKLAKKVGLKVSSGRLQFGGLKLKGGHCFLRTERWLILDRTQPYDEQLEMYKQAFQEVGWPEVSELSDEMKKAIGPIETVFSQDVSEIESTQI
jgi:hypothetical protein